MAENRIEQVGKSREEVALEMTHYILNTLERKGPANNLTRAEYLATFSECLEATYRKLPAQKAVGVGKLVNPE